MKFLKFLKLDGLLESVKGYIEARIQLFKLEMQEKASNVIASAVFIVLMAFCGLMMLMFLSLALGNFLNELVGNSYAGFCILAGFYFLLVLLLAANIGKGKLHRKVQSTIFKSMVSPKKKEEEEKE